MNIELNEDLRQTIARMIREELCIPPSNYMLFIGMSMEKLDDGKYLVKATMSVRRTAAEAKLWVKVEMTVDDGFTELPLVYIDGRPSDVRVIGSIQA